MCKHLMPTTTAYKFVNMNSEQEIKTQHILNKQTKAD